MNREQFIEVVSREQESLRRFLCNLCAGDSSKADDIAQEALLKAYLAFERFEGRSRFSTWLFRIAYNCLIDNMKSSMESIPIEGESPEGLRIVKADVLDETSGADRRFEHQRLYLAIRCLPVNEQAVILLFYLEDKSIKEIETITGMPSGTIRSHLSRGRSHLKIILEKELL
ncbi:MAG: RNA polymerase sigma factor [Candidatus Cryptobacteroides sp.]